MKSGLRSGILSDKAVLISCADQQTIPFSKMNLAPRSGTRISRPQKASYMFNNLPIHQMQKETLINDFVIRYQIQKPLLIPARTYSTLSLDKPNALVRPVTNQTLATDIAQDLQNVIVPDAANTPDSNESVSRLTSEPRSPSADSDPLGEESERFGQEVRRQGRNILLDRQNRVEPVDSDTLQTRITGFGPRFQSPQPQGGRVNIHTHFPTPQTPAGTGLSAASSRRSYTNGNGNGNGNGHHYSDPIHSAGTSRSVSRLSTGDLVDNSMRGEPSSYRGRMLPP